MATGKTVTDTEVEITFFCKSSSIWYLVFPSLKIFNWHKLSPNICSVWKMLAEQPVNERKVPTRTYLDNIICCACTLFNQVRCQQRSSEDSAV